MFRKTLTILSLIGLLLSVGLWGASYWQLKYTWCDEESGERFEVPFKGFRFVSEQGRVIISYGRIYNTCESEQGLQWWKKMQFRNEWIWPYFAYRDELGFSLFFPLWIPTLVFGSALAVLYLPINRRRERKKLGLCLKCGYDLRASKDRCPECGAGFSNQGTTQSP